MADHRKFFRPRLFSIGRRLLPRGGLIGAALALLGALGPVQAQDAGLKSGAASLEAGKYDSAVRQLSATVNHENASPEQAAKALYLRGIAYRKLGEPGRAIADLGAALWLGLPASDKVRALVNKGLAYKAAGLSSQGDAELDRARSASSSSTVQKLIAEDGGAVVASTSSATETSSSQSSNSGESVWNRIVPSFGGATTSAPPPPAEPEPAAPAPSSTRTAAAAPTAGWSASVTDETAEATSGNRVSRWFGSIAGDSAPTPTPAPAPEAPAPQATPKPAAAPPSAASWAANTETTKVVSEGADSGSGTAVGRWFSRTTSTGESAPATAATGGGYQVQLANSRSKAEAEALWKQVARSNQRLASASPQIEKVDIGSFGTFYSLKVGPFASEQEGSKVCNALKRAGTDCLVVSPGGP